MVPRDRQQELTLSHRVRPCRGWRHGGLTGPDPQDDIPPGTVHVAVATPDGGTHAMSMTMNQGRQAVKRRAVTTSLLLLRRALLGELR